MSKRQPVKKAVYLADRAIQDLISIEEFSIATRGKRAANRYLGDIEAALQRLSENPERPRVESALHGSLFFHRVSKQLLVCDLQSDGVYVLTILHASRDIPELLAELEPALELEIEILHQQLHKSRKSRR